MGQTVYLHAPNSILWNKVLVPDQSNLEYLPTCIITMALASVAIVENVAGPM